MGYLSISSLFVTGPTFATPFQNTNINNANSNIDDDNNNNELNMSMSTTVQDTFLTLLVVNHRGILLQYVLQPTAEIPKNTLPGPLSLLCNEVC